MLKSAWRRFAAAGAPFAADFVMLAAAIAFGIATFQFLGSAWTWLYVSVVLFIAAWLIARPADVEESE